MKKGAASGRAGGMDERKSIYILDGLILFKKREMNKSVKKMVIWSMMCLNKNVTTLNVMLRLLNIIYIYIYNSIL